MLRYTACDIALGYIDCFKLVNKTLGNAAGGFSAADIDRPLSSEAAFVSLDVFFCLRGATNLSVGC